MVEDKVGTGSTDFWAISFSPSATERGRVFGQMLFASSALTFGKVHDASDRIRQYFDTVTVAYALAWYQRVNGQYPDSLAKLAPVLAGAHQSLAVR